MADVYFRCQYMSISIEKLQVRILSLAFGREIQVRQGQRQGLNDIE